MERLKNKVAIITGGARGIGKVFSLAMAAEGAVVVIADILYEAATETTLEIKDRGGSAIALKADVTSEHDTLTTAQQTIDQFGRIDILVNNAAMVYGVGRKPFTEIPVSEWDRMMSVSLKGSFLCTKAVFPQMKEQNRGKIINISSETAFTGSNGFLHYVTSKGALISFTRSLASEIGQYGICVNAIAPGFTDTEAARTIIDDIGKYDVSRTPLRRLGQPADLIGAVIFLSSDEADFITGQTLVVNGGRYMN
ncbi:MAG: SDR family NAD(P)-dependent oxidoreductase [Desulfomonilaceae bacterium]